MKKDLFIPILIIVISITCGFSCKKSNQTSPALPPITQVGANTFGCKVNGKIWVPDYPCVPFGNPCSEMEYLIGSVYDTSAFPISIGISVGNSVGTHSFFHFGILSYGVYIYGTGNVIDSLDVDFLGGPGGFTYHSFFGRGSPHILQLTKIDPTNKIISGVFEYTLYDSPDPSISDSIVVTDGRFDFQFGQMCRCSQ